MAEIAKAAGVAVPTVYLGFRTKPALFAEEYAYAVKGEAAREPTEEAWFAEMSAEPDAGRAVRLMVDGTAEILRRVAPLESAMRGLSGDPDLAEFERYGAGLQRAGFQQLIDVLSDRSALRGSLTREEATSVLLVILGPDMYRSFTLEHGWSDERWRAWSVEALLRLLFPD